MKKRQMKELLSNKLPFDVPKKHIKVMRQKHYSDIEIDATEKDCIMLWSKEKTESNVVIIEREFLSEFIEKLKKEL